MEQDCGVGSTVADSSLRIVTALSAEVAVLRERLEIVEQLAAARGLFGPQDVDSFTPDASLAEAFKRKREAFIARVFGGMCSRATGKGDEDPR